MASRVIKCAGGGAKRWVLLAVFAVSLGLDLSSGSIPQRAIPSTLGWHELGETEVAPLCPDDQAIQGHTGCQAVIAAWNGGVADVRRNRLLIWGGGHQDYFGNEVYAFDLNDLKWSRLTEPSPVGNVNSCPEEYPDGRPVARHTYNGLVYLPREDEMFSYGGSKSSCGSMSTATWTLALDKLRWSRKDPHSGDTPANAPGVVADFDPNTNWVFLADTYSFFQYDRTKNSYTRLSQLHGVDYHLTGVIDPARKLFLMMGGSNQLWAIDIRPGSSYKAQDWSRDAKGCETLMRAPYPGLAYDPVQKVVVGWTGGDSIYLFDPSKRSCSTETFAGGPGRAQANGTNGRFRYFPTFGVFILVNDTRHNTYALRLTSEN